MFSCDTEDLCTHILPLLAKPGFAPNSRSEVCHFLWTEALYLTKQRAVNVQTVVPPPIKFSCAENPSVHSIHLEFSWVYFPSCLEWMCAHEIWHIETGIFVYNLSQSKPVSCPYHSVCSSQQQQSQPGGSCLFEGGGRWHRLPSKAVITLKSKMAALGNGWTGQ